MRKSGTRIKSDIGRIHSHVFADLCRNGKPNVFVRNRKMPLDDLAFSMINRKGLTLKLELRGYFYSDPDTELYTYNGFLVLAVDGSDINDAIE